MRIFYHGSDIKLPTGFILKPRAAEYESNWGKQLWYKALEHYRPESFLAHRDSIFMVGSEEDVDFAGGGTEWLFSVIPTTKRVERHDINWVTKLSGYIDDNINNLHDSEVADKILELSSYYWWGMPFDGENVWEYLTPAAVIIEVEKY